MIIFFLLSQRFDLAIIFNLMPSVSPESALYLTANINSMLLLIETLVLVYFIIKRTMSYQHSVVDIVELSNSIDLTGKSVSDIFV